MKMTKPQMTRMQLLLPENTIEGLNTLVENGHFINIQDAARFLLKNGIENYEDNTKPPVLKNTNSEPNTNEVTE